MPLETVKLRGTKLDRVGVQSSITMLGLLGRVFSSRKTSLVSCGSYAGVHGCANRVGYLTGFAVNWRSPTLYYDFNWLNGKNTVGLSVNFTSYWLSWRVLQKIQEKPVDKRTRPKYLVNSGLD